MKIKCVDNKFREFIPSDIPCLIMSNVSKFIHKKAYCKHCKKEFTCEPSIKQKEVWRNHICYK